MSNKLVQTGFFDLELDTPQKTWHIGLEDRLQDTLRQRAAKIKAVVAQANFIIGEELATAQKELTYKNGGFIKWLEEEVGIDKERAYEFIRIWEGYKMCADSAHILEISKSVLLESSKKDVPQSAREEIVTRHESGEKITLTTADEIIERHKARIEELEEANEELQGKLNLFEGEKQEAENKIKTLETKIESLEDKALIHEQAKTIIDQKMQANNGELERLKAELEKKSEPIEVEKFVIPPEKEQEIEDLKESIAKLAQDQIDLQKEADENAEDIKGLIRERDRLLEKNQELLEQKEKYDNEVTRHKRKGEVKLRFSQYCDAIRMRTSQAATRSISPIDAQQYFDPEDWEALEQAESDLRRLADECARLKESFSRQFVDATPVVETPIAYIGASNYA